MTFYQKASNLFKYGVKWVTERGEMTKPEHRQSEHVILIQVHTVGEDHTWLETKRERVKKLMAWCVGAHDCLWPLRNSYCIRGIKNISVYSAYNCESRQLSGDGPPTPQESTTSAEISLEVEFLANNANWRFSVFTPPDHYNIRASTQEGLLSVITNQC